MLGWISGRTGGAWILGFFRSLLYRKEKRQRAQGGAAIASPPPAVGLLSDSGELMMARGPLPGSEFLQVDFIKDKLTYRNKKYKETDTNSKPEAGALTTILVQN